MSELDRSIDIAKMKLKNHAAQVGRFRHNLETHSGCRMMEFTMLCKAELVRRDRARKANRHFG